VCDFTEEAFNQMALLVDKPTALTRCDAVATRRDSLLALVLDSLGKGVAVIALIGQQSLCARRSKLQQSVCLCNVTGLACRQDKIDGIAKSACSFPPTPYKPGHSVSVSSAQLIIFALQKV
jgi:hypothetical protein